MKPVQIRVTVEVGLPKWLWHEFLECARRRRRKPEVMLQGAVFGYVQRVADDQLLEDSYRDAQRAGLTGLTDAEIDARIKENRRRHAEKRANGRKKEPHAGRV